MAYPGQRELSQEPKFKNEESPSKRFQNEFYGQGSMTERGSDRKKEAGLFANSIDWKDAKVHYDNQDQSTNH